MRTSVAAILIMCLGASAALAQSSARLLELKHQRALPNLYTIDLGKTWQDTTEYQPFKVELAGQARPNKGCGEDTHFTIMTDYENKLAYSGLEDAFDAVGPTTITSRLQQMFYPNGEVIEREAPTRIPFANTEAYRGTYRVIFNDGRSYRMRHYLTFASGYFVHVSAYNLSKDDLRAAPCYDELFSSLQFHKLKPYQPKAPKKPKPKPGTESAPKSRFFPDEE